MDDSASPRRSGAITRRDRASHAMLRDARRPPGRWSGSSLATIATGGALYFALPGCRSDSQSSQWKF
eukprot:1468291-Pyramimonas_sp.AAC.1